MTFNEMRMQIIYYDKVINKKGYGKYKYTLVERLFAKIMKKYYYNKWERYFD